MDSGVRQWRCVQRKSISLLGMLLAGLLTPCAQAQDARPSSAGQVENASQAAPAVPVHAFFDRTNLLLFSGIGVFRGLDYASTRNMQARGREEILLPDDVVNNSAAFAGVEAAGTVASIGLSYWMHRKGHHTIERWVSIVHIGVTGFGVARNYSLVSKHP